MSRLAFRHLYCLLASLSIACGGGTATTTTATAANDVESETEAAADADADADAEPEAEAEAEPAPEAAPEPEPEPAPEAAPEPAPAVALDPLRPESADDIHQALLAATVEVSALHRLIEPEWGVGTYDPADTGVGHQCDTHDIETHPGVAFAVNEGDRFRCDRDLRRCSSTDPAGNGYAFYFRRGDAGAMWLDAIVHHPRRVPPRDNGATRAFADGGEGVCSFQRALTDEDADAPLQFSVFVGGHTGLVPETLDEQLCGDEAAAAFEERFVPAMSSAQGMTCTRNPTRCTFRRADEEVTVYGGAQGPTAIAVTRPGMFQNLARAQDRALDNFLRRLASHQCD